MSATRRQVARGAKGAARKATDTAEQVKGTGKDAREKAGEATAGVGAEGLFDSTQGGSREPQSIRQELGAIVRETAIEVLAPVARQATRQATKYLAKYAVQQGPKLAQKTLAPRLRNTLDSVADAGGPGVLAKDALGSRSRQRMPVSKAAAAPRKRAVRSGSKSSSSAGSRRQARPSSKSRQRAQAKG